MYTMPPHAPPYPPLPGRFADVTRWALVCEAPSDAVDEIVSPPLEPGKLHNRIEVFFARFNDTPYGGPYLEAGVVVPVRYDDADGSHVAYMYLDSEPTCIAEAGVLAGRETYGWPKKLASMTVQEDNDRVHATVDRAGVRLMEFHFNFSAGREIEPLSGRLPRIQVRVVPRVDGPGAESVTVIRARSIGGVVHSKKYGTGGVRFGRSEQDPIYKLEPLTVLGAIRIHSDGGLDYGEVLARLSEADLGS